ncbi:MULTISPECIES: hypothetical protein [Deefgea]|uniref:Energy-coupling factor transporter transmembrane protein EcfT n=1 Tax=Deefgea chitinilytica TaxID=570276 RepID=A0ABS2C8A5_9NEIS|nr:MULTISPECIES: hypothetical protein [Deefgea]MBM5570379.1 hypothetical protein [Deefgea chitinilytica]MBM9887608.1 hypothetical protein [Deefgea sp. CFH1-16]
MKLHSINILALWLWLLTLLPWLERHYLFLVCAVTLGLACFWVRDRLRRSLPRLKWLLVSIMLVYGWSVPGRYLWLTGLSPTDAGLLLGLEQIARILIVTSSLQLMLVLMTRAEIFTSIFILLTPLQFFNQLQTRFALRFALTLEKAEELLVARLGFVELFNLILRPSCGAVAEYCFEYIPMRQAQQIILSLQCILIVLTIAMGVSGFWN